MTISLVLLTWNELAGCQHDVPLLPLEHFDEVFAVDGGSSDGTVEYLTEQGIRVLRQPVPSLNAACAYAFETATTDAVVFFHPKGTVPPEDVLEFRRRFENGYDLVIASRNMPEAHNEEDDHLLRPRKWFVILLGRIISIRFNRRNTRVTDVLHGFRGMSKEAFKAVSIEPVGSTVDAEMVLEAYRLGMNISEFPTHETSRLHGDTHFKALPTGWRILKLVFRASLKAQRQR